MPQKKRTKNNINMKKNYEHPQITICELDPVEIIATSGESAKHVAKHAGQHIVYHVVKGMFGG